VPGQHFMVWGQFFRALAPAVLAKGLITGTSLAMERDAVPQRGCCAGKRAASQNFESSSLPQPDGTTPAGGVRDVAAILIFMTPSQEYLPTLLTRCLPSIF
jgi:hypothetical protein